MEGTRRKCVILVTGASGFFGQHVVSALAKYTDHVTEIRTFDKVKYKNKLDFPITKKTQHFEGDILDKTSLTKACEGADGVIHLAGIIDLKIQPNVKTSYLINVEGTRTLLEVCKEVGVKRFIYCSSVATVSGLKSVNMATEDSLPTPPLKFLNPAYGGSKYEAERLVLEANCKDFHTIALRPGIMYGEQNWVIDQRVRRGWFKSTYIPDPYDLTGWDWVYAGNVAWAFIRAEVSLHEGRNQGVSGEAYFITDDTPIIPNTVHYSVLEVFFEDVGLKPVMPLAFFRLIMCCCILFLNCLSWVQINVFKTRKVNEVSRQNPFRTFKFTMSSEKAKRLLDYEPVCSYEEAKKRTIAYIRTLL